LATATMSPAKSSVSILGAGSAQTSGSRFDHEPISADAVGDVVAKHATAGVREDPPAPRALRHAFCTDARRTRRYCSEND
jgi:hypothetical protein